MFSSYAFTFYPMFRLLFFSYSFFMRERGSFPKEVAETFPCDICSSSTLRPFLCTVN